MGILSKLVDFGIEPIVFREFSKDRDHYLIFNTGLNLRLLLYIILVSGFNLLAPFINMSLREIILSNILFLTIIFSAKMVVVRESLATPFKVNLKMHYPMMFSVMDNIILLFLIIPIKYVSDPIFYFVVVYTVSNLPGFLFSIYFLKKKFGYKYQFTFDKGGWLLRQSLPLFGFAILSALFQQLDVLVLDAYQGKYAVGIYSAGARLTLPLSIIPSAIITTVFPILVKRMADKEDTAFITNLVIKLLYVIAFVIAAVFTFEASSIVVLVLGRDYAQSAISSSILYWCQIFLFFSFYSLSVLLADNRQHYNFIYSALQVVVNFILILILIPKYSFFGASIAKLITSFVSFLFVLFALSKFGFKPSIGRFVVLRWSIILALVLWGLSLLPLIPYLFLAAIAVASITIISKLFSQEEVIMFFKLVNKEELGKKIIAKIY